MKSIFIYYTPAELSTQQQLGFVEVFWYVALLTRQRDVKKVCAIHLGLRTLRSTRWTRVDTPPSLAFYVPPCTTMARGMWSLQTLASKQVVISNCVYVE